MHKPGIVIVTPALASANNGNWQTAHRWARFLAPDYRVLVAGSWAPSAPGGEAAAMIALHARRSADSIAAWRAAFAQRPLAVVLTGTDLYRDIDNDPAAQRSLQLADRLVVLNELGAARLAPELRAKTVLCLQSAVARAPRPRTARHLRALMVGHLREEKSPETYFGAVRRLAGRRDILLDHIGAALDPALGRAAQALMGQCPQYRWLGALPHAATRARIAAAHVLVHASRMEGGAHVVIEALSSATPVLASRIDGNVGLLGTGYRGLFEWGDDAALATLLQQAREEPAMLHVLERQCRARAPLFTPERERATLLELLATMRRAVAP